MRTLILTRLSERPSVTDSTVCVDHTVQLCHWDTSGVPFVQLAPTHTRCTYHATKTYG